MRSKNSQHKIKFILAGLIIVLALVFIAQFTVLRKNTQTQTGDNSQRTIQKDSENLNIQERELNSITVDFGDGRKFTLADTAETAFHALELLANREGFTLATKEYKYGLIVESIGRVRNTADKFWIYAVNGQPAKIAADRYILAPGDSVEWNYVKSQ